MVRLKIFQLILIGKDVYMSKQRLLPLVLTMGLFFHGNLFAQDEVTLKQSFHNADIVSVIEAVSKLTQKNFIIDPRVKGKVTLLAPEPMPPEALYETLLMILKVHGYVAIASENATRIVPANVARDQVPFSVKNKDKPERWVTEVLPVRHVAASKLVAILRPLVAREGHLVAMAESNKLIVTDTENNIVRLKSILRAVDADSASNFELVAVQNASAEELVRTLKGVMPKTSGAPTVTFNFDERSNRIILSGPIEERKKVKRLIAELDVALPSVGRVQVIYLNYAKAKDLVPVLQKISTNQSLINSVSNTNNAEASNVPPAKNQPKPTAQKIDQLDQKSLKESISIEADERMNAVVISAPPQVLSALKGVIKQLDIRRAQVLIEAIFVEVSEAKQAKLGVEWGAFGNQGVGQVNFSGAVPTIATALASPSEATKSAAASSLGAGAGMVFGEQTADGGWGALIGALSGDSGSNILSTPTLLTLDNEEAEIIVGREVPFQTGSYSSTGSGSTPTNPFSTIERKNVGLKLKVKPQINEGSAIFLEIDQEVSDVLPKSDAVDLETTKRQIKANIIVGDGEIVVLGGLLTEKETDTQQKVPGLGDIPILGHLFRYTEQTREKVNLMVFLRPVIVRDDAMSNYYSMKKYSHMHQQQQKLLQQDDGLLEGLRPKMPSAEQWRRGEQPIKPADSDKMKQAKAQKETKASSVVIDELLDIE